MKIHNLKTWPEYYEAVINGVKTFEARVNDRDFKVGDVLNLIEYDVNPKEYTGRNSYYLVTYIFLTHNNNSVIMSIKFLNLEEQKKLKIHNNSHE